MNKLEKLQLISLIGRELQSRMTYSEINSYFKAYKIKIGESSSVNSKWAYVKDILPNASDETVLAIGLELGLNHPLVSKRTISVEDSTFWKPGHFRLFITHLASFKKTVSILKQELENYGISAFVAHEDIEPTKEWQDEIEKGLFSMDALCAVLMPGFKESNWTDQEIGVAIGREVLIIPIRKQLDPYGFIAKYQGFQSSGKNIGQVAMGIFDIIANSTKTKSKLSGVLIDLFLLSKNSEEGLGRLNAIKKLKDLPEEKVKALRDGIVENQNLKESKLIIEFNNLIADFKLEKVTARDFEAKKIRDVDDLPF